MDEDQKSFSVSVLSANDYRQWDEFVFKSPHGTFFHSTTWANILSKHFHRPYRILLIHWNNQPAAGSLIFEQRRCGQTLITPLPLYPYNGPVLYCPQDEKPQKTIADYARLNKILITYLNQKYLLWILESSYLLSDVRPFQWAGCNLEPCYTYILPLHEPFKLEERYSQSLRKKIRRAGEMPHKITVSTDPDLFIRLYLASYHRHGIKPLLNSAILQQLLPDLLSLPHVKMYYLELQNRIVAGRIVIFDRDMIYDLLAGSNDESGLGSAFLLSSIIQSFSAPNITFNFLGADHPQIEKFKRSFGGQLVHGFRITSPLRFPLSLLLKIRRYYLHTKRRL